MGSAMKANRTPVAGAVTGTRPGGPAAGTGGAGLGSAGGQRLPVAPRERKPALAALAVLLILGGALTSAYLVMASGQRVSAIAIAQPVAAGQRIPASALKEVPVGDTGIQYLDWANRQDVTSLYATVPLVPDTLLTNKMLSRGNEAAKGRVVVGLALKPGQFPVKDLAVGKRVGLYAVGGGNSGGPKAGTVLSGEAIVVSLSRGGSGDRLRGDQTTMDVAVPPGEAALLTQAASAGTVAVALLPDGTRAAPADGGAPPPTTEKPARPGDQPSPGGQQAPNTGGN
ncbi:hypothetical protein [Actinomadura hibisca]|uniref:hypothetical protein n=1 Tax=Actinomadura hibisca TaxID=68565 RepID=UPI000AC145B9|nr:hypothetical protein [Actinomadura hibisca]